MHVFSLYFGLYTKRKFLRDWFFLFHALFEPKNGIFIRRIRLIWSELSSNLQSTIVNIKSNITSCSSNIYFPGFFMKFIDDDSNFEISKTVTTKLTTIFCNFTRISSGLNCSVIQIYVVYS